MALTFYYSPQSSASRVHDTLTALGIPYEEKRVDLRAGDQKKPEFLALNPNGKVPTIVLDGTPMFESIAIQIALGERFGVEKGLWPALGSPEHLTALTWLCWGQVTLGASLFRYMHNTSEWHPKEQHNAAQAAAALKELGEQVGMLDAHLKGRDFVTGPRLTLADIDLVSVLGWGLDFAKIDTTPYPNVAAWIARTRKRLPPHSAS
ncbi:MAG: glutathione S-transferase family protein [Nannocystis sp.]|uniref:glutathione S-transferase family protein n=1 Tax=Nannocystis sp. TaxID=1962667 RepID=UPI00242398BE|nr:glutathione S-transferase family protein [Nannocystis sp.]MBK9752075.1 glutathione S-transferase family protein [Nannocystis sp.]